MLNDIFKNHENDGYLTKDEWKENSYVVYVYEIEEFNSAYVGLTNNMKRRDREHLFSEKEKMSLFCKENDIPYPKYKILEEDLTSSEAQRQEDYWEKSYRNNGWTIFNISRTGSLGNFRKKWTKKALQEEADKYETRFEFQKNSNSAYSTAQRTGLLDELFKNHYNKGLNKKASKENLQKYVDKYETRKEFKKNYPSQYTYAQKTGILDELFKNHPNKGIHQKRWTKERLQEEADKYETRDDFRINSNSAYSTAQRTGLLAELFKNHPNKGFLEIYWTEKRLQEEANKYKTSKEFRKMSKNGYSTAVNKHILDELFKNHPNNGYTKIKN